MYPGTPPVFAMHSRRFIQRNITSYLIYGVLERVKAHVTKRNFKHALERASASIKINA